MPCSDPHSNMASAIQVNCSDWLSALRCSICRDLFRKPRILPCGHTFCSDCLTELRDGMIKTCRKSPLFTPVYNSSFPDPNGSYGTGITFTCPDPDCQYTMKLMNLSRWALRNRTLQDLVSGIKRHTRDLKEVSTQTDINMDSALVAIPRGMIPKLGKSTRVNGKDAVDSNDKAMEVDHSVTVGKIIHRAFSMDSLNQNYIPSGMTSWKSCAALIGANILEQLIHM